MFLLNHSIKYIPLDEAIDSFAYRPLVKRDVCLVLPLDKACPAKAGIHSGWEDGYLPSQV